MGLSAKDLYRGGFTLKKLRKLGFKADQVIDCCYKDVQRQSSSVARMSSVWQRLSILSPATPSMSMDTERPLDYERMKELRRAGYSVTELIDAGILPETLKRYGFSARDFRHSQKDANLVYSAGFSVKELLNSGYKPEELIDVGVALWELRKNGVPAYELQEIGVPLKEMKKAGYTIADMSERGEIPIHQLKKAGFTADDLLPQGRKLKKGDSSLKLISGWRHSRPDLDDITTFSSCGKDVKKLKKARQAQNER